MTSNPQRSPDFLYTLADGISNYMNLPALSNGWDYFTYLTDKKTTMPPNKMKEIFDLVKTPIPKVQLLKWANDVQGSLRNQNLYSDRQAFLQKYLSVENPLESTTDTCSLGQQVTNSLVGKNIIVLDDQLTTGATAWHVIRKLKEKGAKNVLFIAMFQMILPVNNDVICPRCGRPMLIKMRRSDGHRFYSCTPPQYGGMGCGYIQDINDAMTMDYDIKYNEIIKQYPDSVNTFLIGKSFISEIEKKKNVVDSLEKIKLIDKHELYIRCCTSGVSDEFLEYVQEIDKKGNELIYNNKLRNQYYGDFTWYYSDYYDHELACLEYSLDHIKELDTYIESLK